MLGLIALLAIIAFGLGHFLKEDANVYDDMKKERQRWRAEYLAERANTDAAHDHDGICDTKID